MPRIKTTGQVAYEAYCNWFVSNIERAAFVSSGHPELKMWEALSSDEANAWEAAADAVLRARLDEAKPAASSISEVERVLKQQTRQQVAAMFYIGTPLPATTTLEQATANAYALADVFLAITPPPISQ